MSRSAATPRLSPEMAKEALAYLRRAAEKLKALQAAEKVLASVERVRLQRRPEKFELKPLVTAINALNLALREKGETEINTARTVVSRALESALQILAQRDEGIRPSGLRQFCEQDSTSLDLQSLAALTWFYRTLPPTAACRSKYDFVITRLFSRPDSGRASRYRQLRISREQVTKRLTEMCEAWGETIPPNLTDAASEIIQQLDDFKAEVKEITQLEDLVRQSFFQRVRQFKAEVGNLLFLPAVTAASIEANLALANHFLTLLEMESAELQSAPAALLPLADAFSDTYSNEPDEIARLLAELQASTALDEAAPACPLPLPQLLQLAIQAEEELRLPLPLLPEVSGPELSGAETDDVPELPAEFISAPTSAVEEEEWDDDLQALAEQPENQDLFAAYRHASPAARNLDLHCFLSPLPEGRHADLKGEGKWRRAALELIFRADQLAQTELGEEHEPAPELEPRVNQLFDDLGQLSDEMRGLIKVTRQLDQDTNYEVLLQVYNQLMAARLRLQSALVRRSTTESVAHDTLEDTPEPAPARSSEAARAKPEAASETPREQGEPKPKPGLQMTRRKWLIMATIVLVVVALGMRLALPHKQARAKDDADVVRLTAEQMPNGELFTQVKLHQDLMICLVTEKWLMLSAREQKEKLRELLLFGTERGAVRIMLLDDKGLTVGFVTKDDLYVN